jgi:energy-coupling factor transporter ATP-binding protein EcfA2
MSGFEFRNVSFAYTASDTKVLERLSFRLDAGERIAIVGQNGAGKSTLVKLMARLYDPTATAVALQWGVVKGLVLEQASGSPLARTQVRLQPVPNASGNTPKPLFARAERAGQFVFPLVPDGLYLLIATREYFFPTAYGQRRPTGQGTAIRVTSDSQLFAELRMHRMGSITGRVLDENNVGIPQVSVLAYQALLPLRAAGQAESDDRGVYRIHGLRPGKYWVRTAPHKIEDGSGLLPTFGPESLEAHGARVHQVNVDMSLSDGITA